MLLILIAPLFAWYLRKENKPHDYDERSLRENQAGYLKENESHDYVDLGLPSGTLWATCNVGASSPEEYGDYFAWGETQPKLEYSVDTYFDNSYEKYYPNICHTELLPEDDAAYVNWGTNWRMPSDHQLDELIRYTTTTWTTLNGVNGYKLTSKMNGNSIFLSAAGCRRDTSLDDVGLYGVYWSRSFLSGLIGSGSPPSLCDLSFDSFGIYTLCNSGSSCVGQSVRAVRVPQN